MPLAYRSLPLWGRIMVRGKYRECEKASKYASICYQLFTTDAQVVVIGEQILHFLVPTYFTYIAIEILSGTLRGIGDSWLPMIICCLGICALRVVWILTAVPLKNDILTIVFSYPLTWTVTSIAFIVYYLLKKYNKDNKR